MKTSEQKFKAFAARYANEVAAVLGPVEPTCAQIAAWILGSGRVAEFAASVS